MSAGVLGTAAHDVETALDQALDLCRLWGAILLLDEADVFLGARTDDGLLRNELVSSTGSPLRAMGERLTLDSFPHEAGVLPGHPIPDDQPHRQH